MTEPDFNLSLSLTYCGVSQKEVFLCKLRGLSYVLVSQGPSDPKPSDEGTVTLPLQTTSRHL